MNNLMRNEAFLQALGNKEFLLKTQQQLVKDFAKVNLSFPANFEQNAYEKQEILRLIENEIATISERGERSLLQLLYSVDFSEKLFLELTQQANFLSTIAEQILYREAYKIWLRQNYSF